MCVCVCNTAIFGLHLVFFLQYSAILSKALSKVILGFKYLLTVIHLPGDKIVLNFAIFQKQH